MGREVHIYDFDDTLVHCDTKIHVNHVDGSVSEFTTHQYACYDMKPGETHDFSKFEDDIDSPELLQHYDYFLDSIDHLGSSNVFILTARSHARPPAKLLTQLGVVGVKVIAVAGTDPLRKSSWIDTLIKSDHTIERVVFYDDNEKNVQAVNNLRNIHPNVEIVTYWVNDNERW